MDNRTMSIAPGSDNRQTVPVPTPYRAVLMPEECYQDLRQESGWDFLQDHMLEMLIVCEECGQRAETLTPDGAREPEKDRWLCRTCREKEE